MSQSSGDFTDTFRPVSHMSGVRNLQSIDTEKEWKHMIVDLTQGFIQVDVPKGGKTKSQGFESVGYEKSMRVKKDDDQQIMLCTHVNDSSVTSSSEVTLINFCNRILSSYGGRFDCTVDMDAKEYVGMEWERDANTRSPCLLHLSHTILLQLWSTTRLYVS
jgi:hypothetical protein